MLAEGDTAEDVSSEPLLSLWLLEGLLPGGRGELEDAGARPGGQEAQEVAEVAEGLDAVHLAAGERTLWKFGGGTRAHSRAKNLSMFPSDTLWPRPDARF